jgi:ribosomal protein S18 acetylase RimI-like enzyme
MIIRPFRTTDTESVVQLWTNAGLTRPWNDPYKDIERKLAIQPELFFVGEIHAEIMASIMVGYEGHRGWVNYLAVSPAHQRQGYGQQLMAYAEATLLRLGCPKLNLQVRTDNSKVLAFYTALGYANDAVMSFGKRLIAD